MDCSCDPFLSALRGDANFKEKSALCDFLGKVGKMDGRRGLYLGVARFI